MNFNPFRHKQDAPQDYPELENMLRQEQQRLRRELAEAAADAFIQAQILQFRIMPHEARDLREFHVQAALDDRLLLSNFAGRVANFEQAITAREQHNLTREMIAAVPQDARPLSGDQEAQELDQAADSAADYARRMNKDKGEVTNQ